MSSFKILRLLTILASVLLLFSNIYAQSGLVLRDSIIIGGKAKWDYLSIDPEGRRLYSSHGDEVDVIELNSKKIIAQIPAHGSHGIAFSRDAGHGFITNGKANTVTVFDLSNNQIIKETKVGNDPDAITFDSKTGRVFAFNGHGSSASVLDAQSGDLVGTIDLKGSPEFGVTDGNGFVFVNLEDKNETLEIDAKKMKVIHRWSLKSGDAPTGLSIDIKNRILFIGCHNMQMIVMNAANGNIEKVLPIGKGVDATAFDPMHMQAFSSNGDGTLTIIDEKSKSSFEVSENLHTLIGGRTMAIDMTTQDIYIASADVQLPLPASDKKPSFIDGTFKIYKYTR